VVDGRAEVPRPEEVHRVEVGDVHAPGVGHGRVRAVLLETKGTKSVRAVI
jgi:hypothetical protein